MIGRMYHYSLNPSRISERQGAELQVIIRIPSFYEVRNHYSKNNEAEDDSFCKLMFSLILIHSLISPQSRELSKMNQYEDIDMTKLVKV